IPHKWWVIRPITVAYTLIVAVLGLSFSWDLSVAILKCTGIVTGIVVVTAVAFAIIALISYGISALSSRVGESGVAATAVDRGSSMGQMVKEMYHSDKNHVCPLM